MDREGETPLLMDNIGFWNTRGLNKLAKQREVNPFMHYTRVDLFGLLETKIERGKAQTTFLICVRVGLLQQT